MRFKRERVEFTRINTENRDFRISTNHAPNSLRDSIDGLGLLNPPILLPKNDSLVIVSGFKRIEAARGLGWRKIPCKLFALGASQRTCVRVAISENSMQRPLDIIETSRALALLKTCFDKAEISREALRLGLPANRRRIDELEKLCKLPPDIVKGILSDSIAVPIALELSKMPENEMEAFAELFLASNCSLNKQREIVQMTKEIGRRDDESIIDILSTSSIQSLLRNPDTDKNRKAREIRSFLRKIRYPNIVEAEKNFAETVDRLGLDPGMKLIPPKDFEGSLYGFFVAFKNTDELKNRSSKLQKIANGTEIKSLFD